VIRPALISMYYYIDVCHDTRKDHVYPDSEKHEIPIGQTSWVHSIPFPAEFVLHMALLYSVPVTCA